MYNQVKTQLQARANASIAVGTQHPHDSMLKGFSHIVKQHGIKGNQCVLFMCFPVSGVINQFYHCIKNHLNISSLRPDTQLRFSLHFIPLGIRFPRCVTQPFAFLVLETIILGHYSTHC